MTIRLLSISNLGQWDLYNGSNYCLDSSAVHNVGDETIDGIKTFEIPIEPESGGTGTGDTPVHSNLLIGNNSGKYDVATIFGNNGITVGYFEPLKQFSIGLDGSMVTDVL